MASVGVDKFRVFWPVFQLILLRFWWWFFFFFPAKNYSDYLNPSRLYVVCDSVVWIFISILLKICTAIILDMIMNWLKTIVIGLALMLVGCCDQALPVWINRSFYFVQNWK